MLADPIVGLELARLVIIPEATVLRMYASMVASPVDLMGAIKVALSGTISGNDDGLLLLVVMTPGVEGNPIAAAGCIGAFPITDAIKLSKEGSVGIPRGAGCIMLVVGGGGII